MNYDVTLYYGSSLPETYQGGYRANGNWVSKTAPSAVRSTQNDSESWINSSEGDTSYLGFRMRENLVNAIIYSDYISPQCGKIPMDFSVDYSGSMRVHGEINNRRGFFILNDGNTRVLIKKLIGRRRLGIHVRLPLGDDFSSVFYISGFELANYAAVNRYAPSSSFINPLRTLGII